MKRILQKAEDFISGFRTRKTLSDEDEAFQKVVKELLSEIREAMSEDVIYTSWDIDDVVKLGGEMGRKISKKGAREILQKVKAREDIQRVSWKTIGDAIIGQYPL